MALEQSLLETLLLYDRSTLETLVPSRVFEFLLPNEHPNQILHSPEIYIGVIDSPSQPNPPATAVTAVAALLIPSGMESDWIFSTERGILQLVRPLGVRFTRIVLIGNHTLSTRPENYNRLPIDFQEIDIFQNNLIPFVRALCPGNLFASDHLLDVQFSTYYRFVQSRSVVLLLEGDSVGEMLVEDVKYDNGTFRVLRFKRNPNIYQTELHVVPVEGTGKLVPVVRVLIQRSLTAMVTTLSLIGNYLDEVFLHGKPRALCLGVGGGSLISFLSVALNFKVVAVDVDEIVLRVAKEFFGLQESIDRGSLRLIVGDAIRLMEKLASHQDLYDFKEFGVDELFIVEELDPGFDIIFVDLDSRDAQVAETAPPLEFVDDSVFQDARSILNPDGILVINVHLPDHTFYNTLLTELQMVFLELREIKVGAVNGGDANNYILIASKSPIRDSFLTSLRSFISGDYMGLIERL